MKIQKRKKITGTWHGYYAFEKPQLAKRVSFVLKLKHEWFGHFVGVINEEFMPGVLSKGVVDGYLDYPRIEFKILMPVTYIITSTGNRITLQEHLAAQGIEFDHQIESSPILYTGDFVGKDQAKGNWVSPSMRVPFSSTIETFQTTLGVRIPETKGSWDIEFKE